MNSTSRESIGLEERFVTVAVVNSVPAANRANLQSLTPAGEQLVAKTASADRHSISPARWSGRRCMLLEVCGK